MMNTFYICYPGLHRFVFLPSSSRMRGSRRFSNSLDSRLRGNDDECVALDAEGAEILAGVWEMVG